MLQIPLDWQKKFSYSIDDFVRASQTIVRKKKQSSNGFHEAFEGLLMPTVEAQYARKVKFQANFVGVIALEMFRNAWYHAPRPATIETTFWYNKTTCIFGIADGGPYFRDASVKEQWELAHASRDLKAIKTSVVKPGKITASTYAGGANQGTSMALHAPYLRVNTAQGALFLGFRNNEINN